MIPPWSNGLHSWLSRQRSWIQTSAEPFPTPPILLWIFFVCLLLYSATSTPTATKIGNLSSTHFLLLCVNVHIIGNNFSPSSPVEEVEAGILRVLNKSPKPNTAHCHWRSAPPRPRHLFYKDWTNSHLFVEMYWATREKIQTHLFFEKPFHQVIHVLIYLCVHTEWC